MHIALTGAASGIGAEVVKKAKSKGWYVTAFDIAQPSEDVDDWVQLDLGNLNSIEKAVRNVNGPFDALLNNAGLPPRAGNAEQVLQVNFVGLMAFQNLMLPCMRPGASVVNTASRAGGQWRENIQQVKKLIELGPTELPDFVTEQKIDATRAYNLSKEALIVQTILQSKSLMDKGLRTNSVSPAAVNTEILDDFKTAFGDKVDQNIALVGRPGSAHEIADVILFLASPESHWIKGQDIVVDGGMMALAMAETIGA